MLLQLVKAMILDLLLIAVKIKREGGEPVNWHMPLLFVGLLGPMKLP